ncbi:MAG TPA: hypothetical protein VMW60_04325 [Dehalococcoidales bacterium]|nr:hypothetical protein [Dehalococcoidales bacterium]
MTKVDEVIEKAQDAFWKVVAESYPEVKTGDLPPEAVLDFEEASQNAVQAWLRWNKES